MRRRHLDLLLREQSDWLCRAADAFQRVILCTSRAPIDAQKLRQELARIPAPTTRFEHLALRYLMFDSFAAITSNPAGCRLPRPREFVTFLDAVHSDSDAIPRFSKLVIELCRSSEAPNASLAEEIGRRIEREYASRMTAERMAQDCKVSRVQLDRTFVQRFGLRFHEYLTAVRVRRGIDLVIGGMKIDAVALAVGYPSKKDFYRAVRLHTGVTPGQLRRQRGLPAASRDV